MSLPVMDRELFSRARVNRLQAAAIAGVSVRTIDNWMALGKVEVVRTPTGSPRIYVDSLLRREARAA